MTSQRTRDRMIERLREQKIRNRNVLATMRQIPRHLFVDEALASRAYEDSALPIGLRQTISQPYVVARMTELILEDGKPDSVLEVGTGSGYQTAILASLTAQVYTVERLTQLQQRARRCLQSLDLHNIEYLHSDGGWGWPDHAPYDAILVTAAPAEIPTGLLGQMAANGVMVIPIGEGRHQELTKITRTSKGEFEAEVIESVTFVPLLTGSQ
ncbi:MAG TPA: protein-L-isoaspartate(D-aspartate) O-methyltransferase [Crenotrichaceae bacterium]|nr:protein-L-isoaspartate(D-aspartate) O-methyltransferase [Crenotrichaceae bacterium]